MTPTPGLCEAPGCLHQVIIRGQPVWQPRPAAAGTHLCDVHHTRFGLMLRDLSGMVSALAAAAYTRPAGSDGSGVSSGGVQDVGSSWNPQAAVAYADLTDWVRFVVRTVLNERPIPAPSADRPWMVDGRTPTAVHGVRPDGDPRVMLLVLQQAHARWLSAHHMLGVSLLTDAQVHISAGRRALSAGSVRRILLSAVCQETGEFANEDGTIRSICAAPLAGIIRDPGYADRPSEILCTADPTHPQITRDRWPELLRASGR